MGKARRVRPLTLDAGALVAIERRNRTVRETIRIALEAGMEVIKASGELCGGTHTRDVVDASVVVCARAQRGGTVLTSDPSDIRNLDSDVDVEAI